jgi:uncharacterized protein
VGPGGSRRRGYGDGVDADEPGEAAYPPGAPEAMMAAVSTGDVETVRVLLARSPGLATMRTYGGTSLARFAAYNGQREIAYLLLQAGADLDVFDAASFGAVNELAIMLDLDPNLAEAVSDDGYLPIHFACMFDQHAAVRVLLGHAASHRLPSQNDQRVFPLHSAVSARSRVIVDELLDAGADPNVRKQGEVTPLMLAAANGDEGIVEELLARGADPAVVGTDGKDAARLARDAGFTVLARRLEWLADGGPDAPAEPFIDDPGLTVVDGMDWDDHAPVAGPEADSAATDGAEASDQA